MRVALYDIDSKIPNLALMKLSAFHKAKGDRVEWYSPLLHTDYDIIYGSMIFTFSDPGYIRKEIIMGGSGIDLHKELPPEIEHCYPDYDLYGTDYAMGFITRGCSRECPWCIVPQKEGTIRKHAEVTEFTKDQRRIMLLDNNFLAYHDHLKELNLLVEFGRCVDFNQGLDIRLINEANATLLSKLKRWKGYRLRFSLDENSLIPIVDKKLKLLNAAGIKNSQTQFYMLVGFNTTYEEDLARVHFLYSRGCAIFVMPYNKFQMYDKTFARWVNRYFYKYIPYYTYLGGKN